MADYPIGERDNGDAAPLLSTSDFLDEYQRSTPEAQQERIPEHIRGEMRTGQPFGIGLKTTPDRSIKEMLSQYVPQPPDAVSSFLTNPDLDPAWVASAFIGPSGAQRLANAGLRHGADWGGIERLRAAQNEIDWHWAKEKVPAALKRMWTEFGWTPENTWGNRMGENAQPATAVATPDLALDENAFSPAIFQPKVGKSRRVYAAEGPYTAIVRGLDMLPIAEPEIENYQAQFVLDPKANQVSGSTDPEGLNLRAQAKTVKQLNDVNAHELNHAVGIPQGITPGLPGGQQDHPIFGTNAEALVRDLIEAEQGAYDRARWEAMLRRHPAASGPWTKEELADLPPELRKELLRSNATLGRLQRLQPQIPGLAGYLGLAEELGQGRSGYMRRNATLDEEKKMVPGLMNYYSPKAMPGWLPGLKIPLQSFRPIEPEQIPLPLRKYEKAEGGSVDPATSLLDEEYPSTSDIYDLYQRSTPEAQQARIPPNLRGELTSTNPYPDVYSSGSMGPPGYFEDTFGVPLKHFEPGQ